MQDPDEVFDAVRREPNPLRRAKLAGELIAVYQQRQIELARLRREAIDQAKDAGGDTFAAIAAELGLTRGRITQIRQSAPPPERIMFGVGPVTVAAPLRALPGRSLPVISSEDTIAAERLTQLLRDLTFQIQSLRIPVDGRWQPHGDTVAICGPKSSPVTAEAIASDPFLTFEPDSDGRWSIQEREGTTAYTSAMDDTGTQTADVAYLGRLSYHGRDLFVIAGVHALGSIGAVDYLVNNLPELYASVGTHRFSMVIASEHDGERVVRSEVRCPPRTHP